MSREKLFPKFARHEVGNADPVPSHTSGSPVCVIYPKKLQDEERRRGKENLKDGNVAVQARQAGKYITQNEGYDHSSRPYFASPQFPKIISDSLMAWSGRAAIQLRDRLQQGRAKCLIHEYLLSEIRDQLHTMRYYLKLVSSLERSPTKTASLAPPPPPPPPHHHHHHHHVTTITTNHNNISINNNIQPTTNNS